MGTFQIFSENCAPNVLQMCSKGIPWLVGYLELTSGKRSKAPVDTNYRSDESDLKFWEITFILDTAKNRLCRILRCEESYRVIDANRTTWDRSTVPAAQSRMTQSEGKRSLKKEVLLSSKKQPRQGTKLSASKSMAYFTGY